MKTKKGELAKRFSSLLYAKKIEHKLNDDELADKLGVCRQTLSRRLKNPFEFTMGEFEQLIEILQISKDDLERIRK